MSEGMAGLAKGLAVLEAFGRESPRLTISDAARATGLSRAAARRCLMTLVEAGYLTFDEKFFSPTPRVLRLGAIYADAVPLPQLARPHLTALREALDESVSLAVMEGDESLFVARSEVARVFDAGVRVGARLPLYASATGHALLAGLDDQGLDAYLERVELVARTSRTVLDHARLRERIEDVRREGVAVSDEELEIGLFALAVPVKDARGVTVASISVSAAVARLDVVEFRSRCGEALLRHAEQLGRQL
ncbi:IclR family transcriptional regulator C-terminal domain-containing protein [Nocardioides sp. NPDC047086]|uniref:IclR family transcriptional regulator domain-containing protein n=1 Tax=Nocardioides sp. NPDC047086 TaxID=3154810 RepID=UPI0033FDC6CB